MSEHKELNRLGVVGAGTMGSGIALVGLYAGFEVVIQDPYPDSLARAGHYLRHFLEKKGFEASTVQLILAESLDDLAGCDLIVEAASEDLPLKQEIFHRLEQIVGPETVLATNTSTLSISEIASGLQHPGRVAGMHFFNPAPVLPLVELVRGVETEPEAMVKLKEFAARMEKTAVVVQDTPGFIVNRVARPFYGEALRLLGEGAAPHDVIDLALRLGAGFRMGPFELMDLIGIDINTTAMKSMYEQTFGEPRYRPHRIQLQKMASGHLGRKTGRGFYEYPESGDQRPFDAPPEMVRRAGQVLFFDGPWNFGISRLLAEAGLAPEAYPQSVESLVAAVVVAAGGPSLGGEIEQLDFLLPDDIPILVQCLDTTLEAVLPPGAGAGRVFGFDPMFSAAGRAATLIAPPRGDSPVKPAVEALFEGLGRRPIWISDTPGMLIPRVICMLANEAAFAVQDGVALQEDIDRAMLLGVNYPQGPLSWGKKLGWEGVLAVLEHMHHEYGEERYRPCALVRQWARRDRRTAREAESRD